ncbi:MAG: Rpn family recombination-promoting nuclease/putative transposase [Bacteroidales bacterium]|nr:Rpn family recombination-promoting nuclease/putative transposase [Bacteroidales bacterium]
MGKYISFDWFIKKLLRNKGSFVVLEGFLSVLLEKQIKIQSILESESNQENSDQKFNRVDLLVEDENKEKIIIEVQNDHEIDYFQRMQFGTAKVVTEYTKSGNEYRTVPKVYSINIVYFGLGQGKGYIYKGTTVFTNLNNKKDVLKLTKRQQELFETKEVSGIFPIYYILRVNKFDEEVTTPLKEWISFLKTGHIPDSYTAQGLSEARNVLRVDSLSEEDRKAYFRYMDSLSLSKSVLWSSRVLGYDEGEKAGIVKGRAEGLEQGRAEGHKETALNMLKKGMSVELAAEISMLSVDEVEKLKATLTI